MIISITVRIGIRYPHIYKTHLRNSYLCRNRGMLQVG
ncbi:hypothetical protein M2103_002548 [Ereboglobus sp. PH5-5]|nr:hypothetical protein [Ereboglobus sp. PH5-5]